MKNGILILISGVLGIFTLAISLAIMGHMNRSVELQGNLSTAIEDTVTLAIEQTMMNDTDMLLACMEQLSVALDAKAEFLVDVYQIDAQKGILAMNVKSEYMHPNGVTGDADWERIAIYDKKEVQEEVEVYEVTFYESKEALMEQAECYKKFSVASDVCIAAPKAPQKVGMNFEGWRDMNDYFADFSQKIQENRAYYAAWK